MTLHAFKDAYLILAGEIWRAAQRGPFSTSQQLFVFPFYIFFFFFGCFELHTRAFAPESYLHGTRRTQKPTMPCFRHCEQ